MNPPALIVPQSYRNLKAQPCCGVAHVLPYRHCKWDDAKPGRKTQVWECSSCWQSRENRKPRWCEAGSDLCAECLRTADETEMAKGMTQRSLLPGFARGG